MKAKELMEELFALATAGEYGKTCDTCKAGSPEKEVRKVAVTMFATPNVVREAAQWGADLLIVHEPTYYNHMDVHSAEKLECEKRRLIESTGMTIYRYHDHCHYSSPDRIVAGEYRDMHLDVESAQMDGFDDLRVVLSHPMTPRQFAAHLEKTLGIAHVRICGAADTPCTHVTGLFGAPGNVFEALCGDWSEIVLTGETTEWAMAEYARDAAQLGYAKALLILGHIGSERAGMKYVADEVQSMHPELECRYFEGGEVYTYTDR